MNYRDRFLAQLMICFAIFAAARGAAMFDEGIIGRIKDNIREHIEKNYSIEEIKEAGAQLAAKVTDAPAALTGAVLEANRIGEFGEPIDETAEGEVQAVHAVAGGRVVYSGIDKDLGLCIRIQHEDKLSTYGNLTGIRSVMGDRVKRGEIIGTFDSGKDEEFYYKLDDSVVQ